MTRTARGLRRMKLMKRSATRINRTHKREGSDDHINAEEKQFAGRRRIIGGYELRQKCQKEQHHLRVGEIHAEPEHEGCPERLLALVG